MTNDGARRDRVLCPTVVVVLLAVVVVIVVVLVLCSTGVRPLEAVKEEDSCGENLAGCLVHHLRPVLKVDEGAEAQDAHLPVVEAARLAEREGNFNPGQSMKDREGLVGCELVWPSGPDSWRPLTPGSSPRL